MSSKDSWMFNFFNDDDGPIEERWRRMNGLKAELLRRGNMLVQSNRSYIDTKLAYTDVWDSKHFFSQRIREIILVENLRHTGMADLQDAVLDQTKRFVRDEQLNSMSVEGPWKAYAVRQQVRVAELVAGYGLGMLRVGRTLAMDSLRNKSPQQQPDQTSPDASLHGGHSSYRSSSNTTPLVQYQVDDVDDRDRRAAELGQALGDSPRGIELVQDQSEEPLIEEAKRE